MSTERSKYIKKDPVLIDRIIQLASTGESLNKICKRAGMPTYANAFRWLNADTETRDRYRAAREIGYEILADEIIDITEEHPDIDRIEVLTPVGYMRRQLLRTEARKWALSKMLPKKYGDKVDLNHGGQSDNPIQKIVRVIVDPANSDKLNTD